jgi:hypothetical protein
LSTRTRDYIWHCEGEASNFITQYFASSKSILYIGAIGFDPRTLQIFDELRSAAADKIFPIFIQEVRSLGSADLKLAATSNLDRVYDVVGTNATVRPIPIFADDRAVVGGRRIVDFARTLLLGNYSDVVIDISAMSRGIFFPLIRCLREMTNDNDVSLHVFVIDHPELDYSYLPQYEDRASYMHGFDGDVQRVGRGDSIRLWLPQLVTKRPHVYDSLFSLIKPSDVCPVLPFPGIDAKRVDNLVYEYRQQMLDTWNTELQNIVLAAESDPLDLYHTVLRVDHLRRKLFRGKHSTFTVLSPMGAKVSTIGGMLAAMDLDLPVAYVETAGYNSLPSQGPVSSKGKLVHVWVDGPIYSLN